MWLWEAVRAVAVPCCRGAVAHGCLCGFCFVGGSWSWCYCSNIYSDDFNGPYHDFNRYRLLLQCRVLEVMFSMVVACGFS